MKYPGGLCLLRAGYHNPVYLAPFGSLLPEGTFLEQNYPENFVRRIDAEICAKALVESAPIIVHARCRAAN
jgi:hypothetical protein